MSEAEQNFRMELEIGAPRSAVQEAVTTPAGIEDWWDNRVEGEIAPGQTFKVIFGRAGWTELRLDRSDPGGVEWACTGQDISTFTPSDEWVGTRIEFGLVELGPERTRLEFVHHGLRPLDCIEICERGWTHHLGNLKRMVEESGVGEPA